MPYITKCVWPVNLTNLFVNFSTTVFFGNQKCITAWTSQLVGLSIVAVIVNRSHSTIVMYRIWCYKNKQQLSIMLYYNTPQTVSLVAMALVNSKRTLLKKRTLYQNQVVQLGIPSNLLLNIKLKFCIVLLLSLIHI